MGKMSSSMGKLVILHCAALCWVLAATSSMHSALLYLLLATIPLHILIVKHTIRVVDLLIETNNGLMMKLVINNVHCCMCHSGLLIS